MKGGEREEGGREKGMAGESARESREAECHTEDGWGRNADVPHIG